MKGLLIEQIWLVINIFLWAFTFYYFWRKEQRISANLVIILSYLGYSIVSYICYCTSYPFYSGINLLPFVFQYIMILIALKPVTNYCAQIQVTLVEPNRLKMHTFLLIWAICSLYTMILFFPHIRDGILLILLDPNGGMDIYNGNKDSYSEIGNGTSFGNIPIVLSNVFHDVGILLTFYYIREKHFNKLYASILLLTGFAPLVQSIAESQRGPAIDAMFKMAISYMLFRPYYGERIKRVARIITITVCAFVFVTIAAITISRFGQESDDDAKSSVYAYVGMENLNFNIYAFDNNGLRYGDRTASMFKRFIGFDNVPKNFYERELKYPHLYINDGVFIGFVGDFLLDYGPIVSFILFWFFSSYFCKKTKPVNNTLRIEQLLLIQFAAFVCMCGGMKLFPYADLGNLDIIALILSYFYFKYSWSKGGKHETICPN